jgi:DNA-binding CsgD family transcriptional regulator
MGGTIIETESEKLIRKGKMAGKADERCEAVQRMLRRGKTPDEIADFCGYDLSYVQEIQEGMAVTV